MRKLRKVLRRSGKRTYDPAEMFDLILKGYSTAELSEIYKVTRHVINRRIYLMNLWHLYSTQKKIKTTNKIIKKKYERPYPYAQKAVDMLRKRGVKVYNINEDGVYAEGVKLRFHYLQKRRWGKYRTMVPKFGKLHIFMNETGKILFSPPNFPARNKADMWISDEDFAKAILPSRKYLVDFRRDLERKGLLHAHTHHQGEGYPEELAARDAASEHNQAQETPVQEA